MKKGWKLLTLCLCLFALFGCSGKVDYEKIQKDLESKGFVIDVKEDKNAIVSVNNNYAPGFNFVLVDGKVASILYINASLTEEILPSLQRNNLDLYLLKTYNSLGIIDSEKGQYYESVQFYLEASRIAQKNPEFKYSSIILLNIGNLFVWLKEYKTAIEYITKAYAMYQIEKTEHPILLQTLIVDIVEVYSMLDELEKVNEWLKISVDFRKKDQIILNSILYANDMREAANCNDIQLAKNILPTFLENMKTSDDYIYHFRTGLRVFDIFIQMKAKEECDLLIEAMDEKNKYNNIYAFMYDYATLKVKYVQAFHTQISNINIVGKYYKDYFNESQKVHTQLNHTYTHSLLVQIELDKINDDKDRAMLIKSQLEKSLQLDGFTQLYNKIAFKQYVEDIQFERGGDKLQAMLVIDIDYFKGVNDTYGHDIGDMVILKVANLLKKLSSSNRITGRFGGDEFVLYMYDFDEIHTLENLLHKLLVWCRKIMIPKSNEKYITISIGAYCCMEHCSENLFLKADEALYKSKEAGRNCYHLDVSEAL